MKAHMVCDDSSDEKLRGLETMMAQFRWLEMIVQMTAHMECDDSSDESSHGSSDGQDSSDEELRR